MTGHPYQVPDTAPRAWHWRDDAACIGEAADAMFPDPSNKPGLLAARTICGGCPVRAACLEAALAVEGGRTKDSRFGIWAGTTPSQRYRIYKSRRPSIENPKPRSAGRQPSPCGTAGAYDRHCRLGEPIDDACRAAHAEKNREQKARQRAARAEAAA